MKIKKYLHLVFLGKRLKPWAVAKAFFGFALLHKIYLKFKILNKVSISKPAKFFLKLILSAQLILHPVYMFGYPESGSNESNSNTALEPSFDEAGNPLLYPFPKDKLLEKVSLLADLATAIENRTWTQTLQQNPQLQKVARELKELYLLSEQSAQHVTQNRDPNTKQLSEIVTLRTVTFSNPSSRPIRINIETVTVNHDPTNRTLILEGRNANRQVVIRQYIPNMDIIDYKYDSEFLFVLDKNKGLLVVHKPFATIYLGKAPIPFIYAPSSFISKLEPGQRANLRVDINTDFSRPPNTITASAKNGMEQNIDGEPIFTRGDLNFFTLNSKGEKILEHNISRKHLRLWATINLKMVQDMVKYMTTPNLPTPSKLLFKKPSKLLPEVDGALFEELLTTQERELLSQSGQTQQQFLLGALLMNKVLERIRAAGLSNVQDIIELAENTEISESKRPLADWIASYGAINKPPIDLENPRPLSTEQQSTLEQWIKSHNLKDSTNINLQQLLNGITRWDGTLNTAEILGLQNINEQKTKNTSSGLRKIAHIAKNIINTKEDAWKWSGTAMTAVFALAISGFFTRDTMYIDAMVHNKHSAFPHAAALIVVPVMFLMATLYLSAPVLQIVKFLDNMRSKFFNTPPGQTFSNFFQQWKSQDIFARLGLFFLRSSAIITLSTIQVISLITSQPHFLHAVRRGVNPFKKVTPDSDIGRVVGLAKDSYLGLSPPWGIGQSSTESEQKNNLQILEQEKQRQIHMLARLISTIAIGGNENINPRELLLFTGRRGPYRDALNTIIGPNSASSDTSPSRQKFLRWKWVYVYLKLLKIIENSNRLDITREITNITKGDLHFYLAEAEKEAEKFNQHTSIQQRAEVLKPLVASAGFQALRLPFATLHKYFETMINVVPGKFEIGQSLKDFFVDHIATVFLAQNLTIRSSYDFPNIARGTAIDVNNPVLTGELHLIDTPFSMLMHLGFGIIKYNVLYGETTIQKMADEIRQLFADPVIFLPQYAEGENTRSWSQEVSARWHQITTTGERQNLGSDVDKEFHLKWASFPFYVSLLTALRYFMPGSQSTFAESLLAAIFLLTTGPLLINSFWIINAGATHRLKAEIQKNKQKIGELKIILKQIISKSYPDLESLRSDYQKVLTDITNFYTLERTLKTSKVRKLFVALNIASNTQVSPIIHESLKQLNVENLQNLSVEQMQDRAKKLLDNISKTRSPFVNQKSIGGETTALLAVAVITSVIAFELINWTGDSNFLNTENLIITIIGSLIAVKAFKQFYRAKRDWKAYLVRNVRHGQGAIKRGCQRVFTPRPPR